MDDSANILVDVDIEPQKSGIKTVKLSQQQSCDSLQGKTKSYREIPIKASFRQLHFCHFFKVEYCSGLFAVFFTDILFDRVVYF